MIEYGPQTKEVIWSEIRVRVAQVNPELVGIIDKIAPDESLTLFLLSYPYGSEILKNGVLHVADKSGLLLGIDDDRLSPHLAKSLAYNNRSNPLSVVLSNCVELSLATPAYNFPIYNNIQSGTVFGTGFMFLHDYSDQPILTWSLTAGVRGIFMLSKIADARQHQRLIKTLNIQGNKPDTLSDHWDIFRQVTDAYAHESLWITELLCFSEKWLNLILYDLKFIELKCYLLNKSFISSEFWRNKYFWDMIFGLTTLQGCKNTPPRIMPFLKQLFFTMGGCFYGFAPTLDETLAPISLIQQAYHDIYELEYEPIIMAPTVLDIASCKTVYYSLNYPVCLEFVDRGRLPGSNSKLLDELEHHFLKYKKQLAQNQLKIQNTRIYQSLSQVKVEFLHADLHDSEKIIASFSQYQGKYGKLFPINSGFLRGYVRFSLET